MRLLCCTWVVESGSVTETQVSYIRISDDCERTTRGLTRMPFSQTCREKRSGKDRLYRPSAYGKRLILQVSSPSSKR
jgi:hypothetical protein